LRHYPVAIVGGGLAGSVVAAMLGRAGIGAALIDPSTAYPPDFRCEKLDASQLALLAETGLAAGVVPALTPDRDVIVARYGRVVERRRHRQCAFPYATLVNAVRAEIPPAIDRVRAKVAALSSDGDGPTLTLSTGETMSARLIVLANGLNNRLREASGMTRRVLSPEHSVSIGFNIAPVGRPHFDFAALTYYPERLRERIAYLSIFPVDDALRANLFVYRSLQDPWMARFREQPEAALMETMPGLARLLAPFAITGEVKVRPVDLYRTEPGKRPGIVLVGDAFATSCPAAGTGTNKVLADAGRLCNVHLPRWLATAGAITAEQVEEFYADPVKRHWDGVSDAKAFRLKRLSTDPGLACTLLRWARFLGQPALSLSRRLRTEFGDLTERLHPVGETGSRP
jgi:2-polyprenyl-6-methoxyphenol hydroxylase-like FAD-dependent oxidoreductase